MALVRDGVRDPEPARHAGPARRDRRARSWPELGRADRAATPAVRRAGRARLVGSRGDLREVPPGDPGRPRGASLAAPSVYSRLRAEPGGAGRARHRHLPVGPVAGHRRPPSTGPGARARSRSRVTNDEASPLARVSDLVLPLRRGPGAEHRRDQDVHGRAARPLAPRRRRHRAATPRPARRVAEHGMDALSPPPSAPGRASARRRGEPGRGGRAAATASRSRSRSPSKLREVGVRNAQGFSAADLLHGHIAAVHDWHLRRSWPGRPGRRLPSLVDCAAALRARGARPS